MMFNPSGVVISIVVFPPLALYSKDSPSIRLVYVLGLECKTLTLYPLLLRFAIDVFIFYQLYATIDIVFSIIIFDIKRKR